MSSPASTVYISASARDLKATREQVRGILVKLGMRPSEDLPPELTPEERLQAILHGIAANDVVVHLAGMASGEVPPKIELRDTLSQWEKASPGFVGRLGVQFGEAISYTQLEARLAYALGKPIHIIVLAQKYNFDLYTPESMPLRALQQGHREILGKVAPKAVQPRTFTELNKELKRRFLPDATTWSAFPQKYRRELVAAGMVLMLGAAAWFGWGQVRAKYHLNLDARQLAQQLAQNTIRHEMVGTISTADQRYKSAEDMTAAKAGLPAAELHQMLEDFAKVTLGNSNASDYEKGLAFFVRKDYATAEKLAVSGLQGESTKEGRKVPREINPAMLLTVSAQFAQNHFADALLTFQGKDPAYGGGAAMTEEDSDRYMWTRATLFSSTGTLRPNNYGMVAGCWSLLDSEVEGSSDITSRKKFHFSPEEELMIRSWAVAEEAAAGKYADALAMARRLEIDCERTCGKESQITARARELQIAILIADGQLTQAEMLIGEARKYTSQDMPADDPNTTQLELLKSQECLAAGKLQEAVKSAEDVARKRAQKLGEEHPAMAEALGQCALALQALGDFKKAEACEKRAVSLLQESDSPYQRPVLVAERQMAMIWMDQGRLKEAKATLRDCCRNERQNLPDDDPETSRAESSMAVVCSELGDVTEAEGYIKEALGRLQRLPGQRSLLLGEVYTNMGQVCIRSGRLGEGGGYLRQALDIMDRPDSYHSPALAQCFKTFAEYQYILGKFDEETDYLFRAQCVMQTEGATRHPTYGVMLLESALHKALNGQFDQAMNDLYAGDEVFKTSLPPDHWRFAWAETIRGLVLELSGHLDEAIEMGHKAAEHYQRLFPEEAKQRIAQLEIWVKSMEAMKENGGLEPLPGESQNEYERRWKELQRKMNPKGPKVVI